MQAVVFHDVGDIRLEDAPEPKIGKPTDAIIRITSSAICGTDLHLVRGTMPGMQPGTILGHEAVGIVEELGKEVRNFRQGDRVGPGADCFRSAKRPTRTSPSIPATAIIASTNRCWSTWCAPGLSIHQPS